MKITYLGYGKEARSAQHYFTRTYPDAAIEIYDTSEHKPSHAPAAAAYVQDDGKSKINITSDIVVRTPSFDPRRVEADGRVTSVTQEFFAACPFPIIGVTGTKGKGTTASLVSYILDKAGVKNWLIGNIGTPALDVLPEILSEHAASRSGVVIYEMSSFQLWDMTKSPHTAVVLMIDQEHLDIHGDDAEYVNAKANITRHQTDDDSVIYFSGNRRSTEIAELSPGSKVAFDMPTDEYISARGEQIILCDEIGIPGPHNYQNVAAAATAAMEYVTDKEVIAEAIRDFRGLPHRLERVAEHDGVVYINDSYSSAPSATIAALKSFERPQVLVIGGRDRGLSLDELASEIALHESIKYVFVIGEARHRIASSLESEGFINYTLVDETDLNNIMKLVFEKVEDGDVVVFSPGFPSFDMFKDFTDRGEQFKEIVEAL